MLIKEFKDMINQQLQDSIAQDQEKQENKKPAISICFTGKRPKDLVRYEREGYQLLFDKLYEFLYRLVEIYKEFDITFLSGGAQGFDQLAFWAVEKVKKSFPVKNVVVIPFVGQEAYWKLEGAFGIQDYNLMLEKADEVITLSDNSDDYGNKYIERNHYMVDHSVAVIGLFNECTGGTGECIHYAEDVKEKGKQMTIYKIPYHFENACVVPELIVDYIEDKKRK